MGSSPEICSFGTNKPGVRAGQPLPGGDDGHLKGDAGPRPGRQVQRPRPVGEGAGAAIQAERGSPREGLQVRRARTGLMCCLCGHSGCGARGAQWRQGTRGEALRSGGCWDSDLQGCGVGRAAQWSEGRHPTGRALDKGVGSAWLRGGAEVLAPDGCGICT